MSGSPSEGVGDAVSYWVHRAGPTGDRDELGRGLLACGRALVERLRDLSEADDVWLEALNRAWDIAVEWLRGERLSTRPDETELRAQLAHDLLPPRPCGERSEVIAAHVLLALPESHPLRDDEAQLRVLRQGMLRSRRVGDVDGELEAVAYLLRHADSRRTTQRLDRRGQSLVARASSGIAALFWASRSGCYSRLALGTTSTSARRRWAMEALTSVERAAASDDIPPAMMLPIRAIATEVTGHRSAAAELYELAANEFAGTGADIEPLVSAGLLFMATGRPEAAVDLLRRAVPRLARQYALALTAEDATYAGEQLTRAAAALAFQECATGQWSAGLANLDRAKSLRLRHQLDLRRSAEADELLRLEQLEFAIERGAGWIYRGDDGAELDGENLPYRTEYWLAPEVRLRLVVREQRENAVRIADPPDPFQVAASLNDDEAVLVLGLAEQGTIAAVLTKGDHGRPTAGWVDTEWSAAQWRMLSSPPALGPVLDVLDRTIGARVARHIGGRVRRLVVIPHLWLHSVPFHAVAGLAAFDVLQLPSLSSLPESRTRPSTMEGDSIVVGNPTGDLMLAGLEAVMVSRQLAAAGLAAQVSCGSEATRDRVRHPSCTLLHFAGHGRADPVNPQRAALLLHHQAASAALAAGRDPLAELASDVHTWATVDDQTREAVVRSLGTLREVRRGDAVERTFEHVQRQTVLIRRKGDQAVAADLWSAGEITAAGDLARCRLAVLTACDAASMASGSELLDETSGLPAALMLAGVGTVVAPQRPVMEDTALLFANRFYDVLATQEPDVAGHVDVARAARLVRQWLAGLSSRQAVEELRRLLDLAPDSPTRSRLYLAMRVRATRPKPYSDPADWAAFVVIGSGLIKWPRQGAPM